MAFTDTQVQALAGKLSAKHVRTRQANGRTLSYIEGWHVIAEANRIFGFVLITSKAVEKMAEVFAS